MRRLALTIALLATLPVVAQTAPVPSKPKEQLRFALILSRHGIRPPLVDAASLNSRSSEPWPGWESPLGYLTPHGADALRRMGAYMRSDFAAAGIFAAACPTPQDIYLYADTDQRNVASTRVTFAAFAPDCPPLPVCTWVPPSSSTNGKLPSTLSSRPEQSGVERPATPAVTAALTAPTRDPIFVPIGGHAFPPPPAEATLAAMHTALGSDAALTATANPALNQMAHILAPDPAHPVANPILAEPVSLTPNATGDPMLTSRGPLPAASSLVEDLSLEYVDAKPLSEVGWGRVGATDAAAEATLRKLVPLHVRAFAYAHRTPLFARAENSNLLDHILDTLQQAAGTPASPAAQVVPVAAAKLETSVTDNPSPTAAALASPDHDEVKADAKQPATVAPNSAAPASADKTETRVNGAFGAAGTKVVYISAHDTNLAGVAALLGLHWTVDGVTDDIPPDSQIIFELWQKPHHLKKGETIDDYPFNLRIRYRAQTFAQLRSASAITAATPPTEITLKPTGCKSTSKCDFAVFLHAARATIDPAYTQLDVPPAQLAAQP